MRSASPGPEAHTVKSASGTVRPGQPVTGASAITLAHQSAGFGEPVGAIAAPASAAGLAGVRADRRGPHRLSTWTPPAGGSWGPKQADSLLPAGDRGAVRPDEIRGPSTTVRSAQTNTARSGRRFFGSYGGVGKRPRTCRPGMVRGWRWLVVRGQQGQHAHDGRAGREDRRRADARAGQRPDAERGQAVASLEAADHRYRAPASATRGSRYLSPGQGPRRPSTATAGECLAHHFDAEYPTFQLGPSRYRAHEQAMHDYARSQRDSKLRTARREPAKRSDVPIPEPSRTPGDLRTPMRTRPAAGATEASGSAAADPISCPSWPRPPWSGCPNARA
jgi:hypothetical protein